MKDELLLVFAASITTLAEEDKSVPESVLYMLCNMNMSTYEKLRNMLISGEFVTIKSNLVTITDAGKALAAKINSVMESNKAAKTV